MHTVLDFEPLLPELDSQEILIDQKIQLTGVQTADKYPKKMRRIAVRHPNGFVFELLT